MNIVSKTCRLVNLPEIEETGDGGERAADTLVSIHTIIRFFCHYFRIYQKTRITLVVYN